MNVEGPGPEAGRQFTEAARKYTDHMIGHMEREDSRSFRIADEMLDDEEKQELGEAFERVQAEFGVETLEKYETLATQLEEDMGSVIKKSYENTSKV